MPISNPITRLVPDGYQPQLLSQLQNIIYHSISKKFSQKLLRIKHSEIKLEHPKLENYGDYATNIALVLTSRLKQQSKSIAEYISDEINNMIITYQIISPISDSNISRDSKIDVSSILERVSATSSGFINLWLNKSYLITRLIEPLSHKKTITSTSKEIKSNRPFLHSKKIMVEFAHPNTHKEFHIGHLRNIAIGESLCRLLYWAGSEVFRANYEGDVGLHVAKAIWGVRKQITDNKKQITELRKLIPTEKAKFLGEGYAIGSKEYEEVPQSKKEIIDLNKSIYIDPYQVDLWQETRAWSLEYFDSIYKRLGTRFDRLFFESEVEKPGRLKVIEAVKQGIFIKDHDGSIYFPGEKYGLNNCVFVTKEDYATYEGKEVALEKLEFDTFPFDLDIHVVANEQTNFFQIAFTAVELLYPIQKGRQYHLAYGMVNLKSGKMSSRTGQVITADDLINQAKLKITKLLQSGYSKAEQEEIAEKTAVAAVKYSMLKVNPRMDISFDLEESVSLEGDSGVYLLYTYARCRSVERKAGIDHKLPKILRAPKSPNEEEFTLLRIIYRFDEVLQDACINLSPNIICNYLFSLAQKYNLFYNQHSILNPKDKSSETTNFRLAITQATAFLIKHGLYLLGIATVERI